MVKLRLLRWPDDHAPLCALETSFTTARMGFMAQLWYNHSHNSRLMIILYALARG